MEEENKNLEEITETPVETPVEVPVESVPTETVEENNEETNNNGKQKKNIPPVLFVILLLLFFGIGVLLGKVLFGGESKDKKENTGNQTNTETTNTKNTETNNTETNTENTNTIDDNGGNLVFDENAKNQINSFIELAMHYSYEGTTIADDLSNGLTGLTEKQKELLTYFAVNNLTVKLTEDMVPEKYKNDSYWNVASRAITIWQLPIQTFKDEYKRLFKEEYTIKGEDYQFGACPFIFKTDLELGYMFYSNQCGGTGISGYMYSNYKYESDENYYYVYQYVTYFGENEEKQIIELNKPKSKEFVVSIPSDKYNEIKSTFEENKTKFETVKWKFDKEFNFISTENIG